MKVIVLTVYLLNLFYSQLMMNEMFVVTSLRISQLPDLFMSTSGTAPNRLCCAGQQLTPGQRKAFWAL